MADGEVSQQALGASVVFLDVDGVIVPIREDIEMEPRFSPSCVEALQALFTAVPGVRVVLSSTWRQREHVQRLHAEWINHGFPESIVIDGTPDLRRDPDTPPHHCRGHEIRAWLAARPDISRWAVLDDARESIEPVLGSARCVFTCPEVGLTMANAERAAGILLREAKTRSD